MQPYPTLTLHALHADGRRRELPHWPRAGMNRRSPETAPSPLSDCARMTGLCCTGSFTRLFAIASRLGS